MRSAGKCSYIQLRTHNNERNRSCTSILCDKFCGRNLVELAKRCPINYRLKLPCDIEDSPQYRTAFVLSNSRKKTHRSTLEREEPSYILLRSLSRSLINSSFLADSQRTLVHLSIYGGLYNPSPSRASSYIARRNRLYVYRINRLD